MDPSHDTPPPTPTPPSPASSTTVTSFPILTIAILGILTTAILLVSYYVFVIKCCLYWRRSHLLRRLLSASSRSSRHRRLHVPQIVHALAAEFRGLEPSVIRSLPIVKFTAATADEREGGKTSAGECAVCLAEFEEAERLKLLPDCSHAFHIDCIDTWLQFNATCPLCRSEITRPAAIEPPPRLAREQIVVLAPRRENSRPDQGGSVVIEVREEGGTGQSTSRAEAAAPHPSPRKKRKKLHKVESMGDECIDLRMEKDEQFCVQPIRRSISMDSSNDRQLYLSVQEFLRQNRHCLRDTGGDGEGSSSNGGGGNGGRVRRSFFSFGRSTRTAVLPTAIDV